MIAKIVLYNHDHNEFRRIFIKSINEEIFSLVVRNREFIKDIKRKIFDKIGLIAEEQILFYQGKILEDLKTWNDYKIINNSIINSFIRLRGGMQLFAKTLDGKTITFEVERSQKIIDIKLKIKEKMGYHTDEQKLIYQGKILEDDDKTVDEYQITDKSMINVVARLRGGMQIYVRTTDGKKVTFEVLKSEKIIDMKMKIQEKLKFLPDEQKLIFKGIELADNKTIGEYEICDQSVIIVVVKSNEIQIFARKMDGDTVTLMVKKSKKFIDIKKEIHEKTGLYPDEIKLYYHNGHLEDDKTIGEYQICEKSVINVVAKLRGEMQIFVKPMGGNPVTLVVIKSDKIFDVKKKIQVRIGMHPDDIKLDYQARMLEDDKNVGEYQICPGSTINILARLKGGITTTIKLFKKEKVDKWQLETRLNLDEQVLIYPYNIIDNDSKTVDQYGITEISIIDMLAQLK